MSRRQATKRKIARKPTGLAAIRTVLKQRAYDLARWLAQTVPDPRKEQRHLDAGSPEWAYWHYGYLVAVRDVHALIQGRRRRLR